MTDRGRFITLEGGEGGGKSTQMHLLAKNLRMQGVDVLTTREPGGSPKAELIREVILSGRAKFLGPMAETLLFSAARIDHLDKVIRPALARGTWVICDRFSDSTYAYQGVSGAVETSVLHALERVVVGESRPDLTLILDLPAEIGLARAERRREGKGEGRDRFEGEAIDFHEKLRARFFDIAEAEPQRCVTIDATKPIDAVSQDIWNTVKQRFLETRVE